MAGSQHLFPGDREVIIYAWYYSRGISILLFTIEFYFDFKEGENSVVR